MQGLVDEKSRIFKKPVQWWFQQDTPVYAMVFLSSNFMHFVTLVMSYLFIGQLLLRMVIGTVVLFSDPSILTQMQGHKIYSVWSLPKQGQDRQWMQALCAEYSQQTERAIVPLVSKQPQKLWTASRYTTLLERLYMLR